MPNENSRRAFLRNASLGSLATVGIPGIVSRAFAGAPAASGKIPINKGDTILFQGDSITDAGRNRSDSMPNSPGALGSGYALLAAGELLWKLPGHGLRVFNRGVSGNVVPQLAARWDDDCIGLGPNVLSILIGVNDYWHTLNGGYTGTLTSYHDDYRALLTRTQGKLPNTRLIVCEPFAVNGVKAVTDAWFPAFDGYRKAAKEMAESFGAVFVPFQSVFDEAIKEAPGAYWTIDGVHPTLAGAHLMARAWLAAVKG